MLDVARVLNTCFVLTLLSKQCVCMNQALEMEEDRCRLHGYDYVRCDAICWYEVCSTRSYAHVDDVLYPLGPR